MSAISKGSLFPPELAKEMFSKVKGHSSLAKLSAAEPVPFNGKDIFVFDFSNKLSIVGESGAKPAGDAAITSKQIRPIKVVYQARVSDEFMTASEEDQIPTMEAFADGFSKVIGAGLDEMAFHGVNPASGSASDLIGNNHFDYVITAGNTIELGHDSSEFDANLEEAIGKVEDTERVVTGIAMAPAGRKAMAALTKLNGERRYDDFAFGAVPANLGSCTLDINPTVSANSSKDRAIVGDFQNGFRWGFAKELPIEIIEYGDPDGTGKDLKQYNQVLLRCEAFIGWAIMDAADFAKVAVNP